MKNLIRIAILLVSSLAWAGPTITAIAVTATTPTTATIIWTTGTGASSQVLYGIGNTGNSTPVDGTLLTNHSVTVSLLNAGPIYNYAVVSQDSTGSTTSATNTFALCGGRSNTAVTGTVNTAYEYGLYTATLVNDSGSGATPTVCGSAVTSPVSGTLAWNGVLTQPLPDNNLIVPSPSHWSLTVTSMTGTGGPIGSFTVTRVITGNSQDISATLQAGAAGQLQHVFYDPATLVFNPPIAGSGGTLTSVAPGTGLTTSPNPIVTTGTISLIVPVVAANGGTGSTSIPSSGQVLVGNAGGTAYAPLFISGDSTLTYTGVMSNTGVHFGATAIPFGTAPSSSQCLFYNGTNITGQACATGSVTTTGSPVSPNLAGFSGSTSITGVNLTGDVTTANTLATTVAAIQGTAVTLTAPALGQTLSINATPAIVNGYPGIPVDTQAGTPYVVKGDGTGSDRASLVNTTNSSVSTAVTVPTSGSTGFGSFFPFLHCNSGTVIATDTATVNGNANVVLQAKPAGGNPQCVGWYGNNSSWIAWETLPTDANGQLPINSIAGITGVQGNGAKLQLSTGTVTQNFLAKFDANGNTINSGLQESGFFISSNLFTQGVTYGGGGNGGSGTIGVATLNGGNLTSGLGSSIAGGSFLTGGSNATSDTASQAGVTEVMPGASTNPTQGLQGLNIFGSPYVKGTPVTQWNLQCESAAMTVADCGATPNNWIGVAESVASNTVSVLTGSQVFVTASAAVTLGHTVCAGSTAGKVTDSGGVATCTNAQGPTFGVVMAVAGAWTLPDGTTVTATTTLPLVQMNTAVRAGAPLASPVFTGTPTAPTQTAGDNSTDLATDAFVTTAVNNAIAGVNPAVAVQAATTQASDTNSYTYLNGVSGIGATLTGPTNNVAVIIDGFTFTAVGQRLLVKNDTQSPSGAFNGVYSLTILQGVANKPVLTRALDYDTPSDMNNTGAIPVVNGTANAQTQWVQTSQVATVGTDAVTFTQFTLNPTTIVTSPSSGSVIFKGPSPWIDVKAYGAVGDGVAIDKTAIQNAINACPTSPVTACIVWFPTGNYLLGGVGGVGLNINTGATGQNNICMMGESYGGQGGTRITYTGSSGSAIAVGSNSQSTSGFCLQDISIVLATGVTASTNGITLTRVNHAELKRVRVDGTTTAAQYGIQITANTGNSQFVQIEEPDIQGIFTSGLQLDGSSSPNVTATTITGGNIQKTGGIAGNGINCTGGDSVAVYNTDIESWAVGINSTCNKDYWGARLEANTIAILNNPTASQDQDAPIQQDGTGGAQITDYGINTRRLDLVASPSNSFELLKDDFIGGTCSDGSIGELGWRLRTIGSVPACSSGGASMTVGLLGNMEVLTNAAATAGQGGTLALDTQGGFTGDLSSVGQWQLEFRFKLNQTTATRFRIGFLNGAGDTTVAPTDGMWLRYDTNAGFADTNFMFETCKASTCSSTSSGIAAESTLFHRVRIQSPSAGKLAFQLDGGTPITFCASGCTVTSTNVPTVSQAVGLQIATDATAQKAVFINKFSFFIKNLQRL